MDSCSHASRHVLKNWRSWPIPTTEARPKSGPLIKTEKLESDLETNSQPVHSKYIHNVLRRRLSHDPTFGVYQNKTDGSFKIGSSTFKYTDKNMLVDDRMYNATQGLWELLTKSKPDKNAVTFQDKQTYKQILLQSNAHKVIVPQVRSKRTKESSISALFHNSLLTKRKFLGNLCNVSR